MLEPFRPFSNKERSASSGDFSVNPCGLGIFFIYFYSVFVFLFKNWNGFFRYIFVCCVVNSFHVVRIHLFGYKVIVKIHVIIYVQKQRVGLNLVKFLNLALCYISPGEMDLKQILKYGNNLSLSFTSGDFI